MSPKDPVFVDRQVGALIRARRLKFHKSQEEMSRFLGITFQQVQKYENGTNRLTVGRLCQIADFLEVEIGYFFQARSLKEYSEDGKFVESFLNDPDSILIVEKFLAIPDVIVRKQLKNLIIALAEPSSGGRFDET